jgi:pimeloyl-ACP methyl ester carboxylesterase
MNNFTAADGTALAWHEAGEGRPVVLLHGLFSDAQTNWIRFGHAAEIAGRGLRVIMPDLRAHGESGKPHDPSFYPPDILADDGLALVAHLGLRDYDLGGYSLGARTAVRMVANGARPKRLIVAGMGLAGLHSTGHRAAHFKTILNGLGSHERGSPEWMAEAFLKTTGGDPAALLPLLDSFVDTSEEMLRSMAMPTLVLSGEDDDDNGSPRALAALLPNGEYMAVPGNHMSAVTRPDLGIAIADFLAR